MTLEQSALHALDRVLVSSHFVNVEDTSNPMFDDEDDEDDDSENLVQHLRRSFVPGLTKSTSEDFDELQASHSFGMQMLQESPTSTDANQSGDPNLDDLIASFPKLITPPQSNRKSILPQ